MSPEPSKVFPCDCMGEGIVVTKFEDNEDISEGEVLVEEEKELRDCKESPFIQLSFWSYGHCAKSKWSWWWRLKIAWDVFRKGTPWPDMVIMKAPVAKNLAHHILYVIKRGNEQKNNKQEPIVKALVLKEVR